VFTAERPPTGADLLERLVDVLIHERLYRDLRDAVRVNRRLDALTQLRATGVLDDRQLAAVKQALDEPTALEIVQIRPDTELPGNSFSGLFDRKLRERYVDEGRRAAETALAQL
jgi:hypothetical protein